MGEYCAIDENGSKPKKKKSKGSLGESFAVIRSSPKVRRGGGHTGHACGMCRGEVLGLGACPGALTLSMCIAFRALPIPHVCVCVSIVRCSPICRS